MKYFIAVALLAAVASARLVVPADLPEALEAKVKEIKPDSPVNVDLPIIEDDRPFQMGPAIIDFPLPEGALTPSPVPSPVPSPAASSSPLVQIIVNVQGQSVPVAPQEVEEPPSSVVVIDEPPSSVVVVDEPPSEVVVVDEAPVYPVNVGPGILN